MRRGFARTPLACNTCRARKTKCDGRRPQCGHCTKRRAQCAWPGPNPSQELQLPSPGALSTSIQSLPDVVAVNSHTPSPSTVTDEQGQQGLQLCLALFFERHFVSDFCSFAYRPEFEQECRKDGALSAAVVALCGRYLNASDCQACFGLASARQVSKYYTQKARLLAKEISDQPSVTNIQTNLVLATSELLSNSGARHWLFAGTAIRMAEIMRLNKDFHQSHSLRHQEVRRRVYWACLLQDRMLAYLLAKHRTIGLDTVSIALPDADNALVYQEETRGVTLSNLAEQRRPSDLGLVPYLIKSVCLWSDMADFAVYSRRRLDWYPPTDPRSKLFTNHQSLLGWCEALPVGLRWNIDNFRNQKALGQQRTFVSMHLLLQSASCAAHQCYLPHLTAYTRLVDLVDAAGWSYLHRDETIINTCVTAALEMGSILEIVTSEGDADSLQSIWAASSILIAANTLLWLQYAEDAQFATDEAQAKAKRFFTLVQDLMTSWSSSWKAAKQWLVAQGVMHDLYKAAYLGEINNHIIDGSSAPHQGTNEDNTDEEEEEEGDFRPQPGDGYPSVISLPNLQASVKLATGDTSAKSISVQSIWLQLSGGWPYDFSGAECLLESMGNADFGSVIEET